ncbi:MAG: methyltransferase [Bryobacteraceae bacterium]
MLLEKESPTLATEPESPPASAALLQLLFGKHITYSLSAIARLGIADHMSEAPVQVDELAMKTGAHSPSLYRVMRMLASLGVFEEMPEKRFSLTAVGQLLKTDAPGSLRYFAIQLGDRWATRAWGYFTDTVRTGEDGVTKAFEKNVFELFAEEPEQAETFNRSMTNLSAAMLEPIVNAYDFSSIDRLADVGGGRGMLLASVLTRYPQMRGVVYDLPEVLAGAICEPHFSTCKERVELEEGSFFDRVPAGCDAYIMKFILHDWSDDHCRKILNLIRRELPQNGRVLVCEQVVTASPEPTLAKFIDIDMLALTIGGKERTEAEFRDLFASAGLRLVKVIQTESPLCVLEARPA